MIILFVILLFALIILYVFSTVGTGMYFDKKQYSFKIIHLIAVFTPIWNTYLALKYISFDFGSIKKAIKYHFTWGK